MFLFYLNFLLTASNLTFRILQHNFFVTLKIQLGTIKSIRSFDILEVTDKEVTNILKNLDMRIIKTKKISDEMYIYLLTGRYLKNKFMINRRYIVYVYLNNGTSICCKPFYLSQLDLNQTTIIPVFLADLKRNDYLQRCIESSSF